MGLDMYLSAKKYYSGGEWHPEENRKQFQELLDKSGIAQYVATDLPSVQLEVSIGYWRKANAVHQWFVDNCQNGEDDCRYAYVGREQLEELKALCQQVLLQPAVASEELPTQPGFFFGSYDYDEWYFDYIKDTVAIIDNCLEMPEEWEFYYHSSW
jgi:hypothetical protein